MPETCFGHTVPPFSEVFPALWERTRELLSAAQEEAVAALMGKPVPEVPPSLEEPSNAARLPDLLLAVNQTLDASQIQALLATLLAEELASQSFFLGNAGRRTVLGGLSDDRLQALLDATPDWVLLETGKRSLEAFSSYTATLVKRERVGGKLQGQETIQLKYREAPRAFYLKWVDGLFKGRQALYNEALLGAGNLRVREHGLLGVAAVTLPVDSRVARRGTNHLATELGLSALLALMEQDYLKAAPRGHIERINHGVQQRDGRRAYQMEMRMPRDPGLGYYAHRALLTLDPVEGYVFHVEIYDHQNQLGEWFHYRDLAPAAPLTDSDFDPKNRAYRL